MSCFASLTTTSITPSIEYSLSLCFAGAPALNINKLQPLVDLLLNQLAYLVAKIYMVALNEGTMDENGLTKNFFKTFSLKDAVHP